MQRRSAPELHGLTRRVAGLLLLAPLAFSASAWAAEPPDLAGAERLSDEHTYTSWAHGRYAAPIRRHPAPGFRPIGRVRELTEDGFPEVYLVQLSWIDAVGREWLKVRIPRRPNGRAGWVRAPVLGRLHLVETRLVVNRRKMRATLYRRGRAIWRSRVGVGKSSTPTPAGRFWIRERIRVRNPRGSYGPWAFGTSAYSRLSDWPGGGVIGVHGTNQPRLIPGRPSHGCIRVPNPRIRRLARLMPVGTPVQIR